MRKPAQTRRPVETRKFTFVIAIYLLLASAARADDPTLVGHPAPPLSLTDLLQAPTGSKTDIPSLRGNVVVLEFWATWCANCVKHIPEFNALADQFKDQPIRFISVTDEDRATIEQFLKTHPIHGWIGLTAPTGTFTSFGVQGRPVTVVIRPDGVVDARLIPFTHFPVRPEHIRNLLAGKPSGIVTPRAVWAGVVKDSQGSPIPDVIVRARRRLSKTAWTQFGDETRTDATGRFRFDREYPSDYVNELPVWLEFSHPDYLFGRLEDLRLFPPARLENLEITLAQGTSLTGKLLDPAGRPLASALTRILFPDAEDYNKDATSDSQGNFTLRGLPPFKGEIRAMSFTPPRQLLNGRSAIDLNSAHTATFQLLPALPPDVAIHKMLGMTVTDAPPDMPSRLFTDHPGVVVIDPGARDWLGIGPLHPGDVLCAPDADHPVKTARELATLILTAAQTSKPNARPLLRAAVISFHDGSTNGGPRFPLTLTPPDIEELRKLASRD